MVSKGASSGYPSRWTCSAMMDSPSPSVIRTGTIRSPGAMPYGTVNWPLQTPSDSVSGVNSPPALNRSMPMDSTPCPSTAVILTSTESPRGTESGVKTSDIILGAALVTSSAAPSST